MKPLSLFDVVWTPGQVVWQTLNEFMSDSCPSMAASISFYTLFSLPPLVVLMILAAEPFLEPETIRTVLRDEAVQFIGYRAAGELETVLENVSRPGQGGPIAAVLGIIAFFFGATAAFAQIQQALNAAWQVAPDPERGEVTNFLLKRVLSFAMILGIGVLILVSLALGTLLTVFGDALETFAPERPSAFILRSLDVSISFAVIAFLFGAMFRLLPDAEIDWKPALFGGVVTALLFTAGKVAIGAYLGGTDPGNAFGAAGSLAVFLIWIYYSSMILLLGAEFTQVWMRRRGDHIHPSPGAVRVVRRTQGYDEAGRVVEAETERG